MSIINTAISGLTNFATDLFGDGMLTDAMGAIGDFIGDGVMSDVVNGAVFGAGAAALGGGDILEGAAYGAAGNAIGGAGDTGIFGSFSNEIGGAITGFGIDKALGGSGLLGAGLGFGAEALTERLGSGYGDDYGDDTASTHAVGERPSLEAGAITAPSPKTALTTSSGAIEEVGEKSKIEQMLKDYGLQNADGTGSVLGKGLLQAGLGYAGNKITSDRAEEQHERASKTRKEEALFRKELDEKFDIRRLSAFKGAPLFTRNG